MTWNQFIAWWHYSQLEPFARERADLHAGIVASTIGNANRDPEKQRTPFSPSDFIVDYASAFDTKQKRRGHSGPITDPAEWQRMKASMKEIAS